MNRVWRRQHVPPSLDVVVSDDVGSGKCLAGFILRKLALGVEPPHELDGLDHYLEVDGVRRGAVVDEDLCGGVLRVEADMATRRGVKVLDGTGGTPEDQDPLVSCIVGLGWGVEWERDEIH